MTIVPSSCPADRLPPAVYADVELYLSRGWRKDLIQTLIFSRHGCQIPPVCIAAVRDGRKCARACGDACSVLATMPDSQPPWK